MAFKCLCRLLLRHTCSWSRYMFYFNDLQMWERQESTATARRGAAAVEPITVFCNLLLASDNRVRPTTAMHSFSGSANSQPTYGDMKSVVEILQRVTILAKRHWYVLDVHLQGPSKKDRHRKAEHKDFHSWLPWSQAANRDVKDITRNPAARLAPAPFCCIDKQDFFDDNMKESRKREKNGQQQVDAMLYSRMQVPQELFFHRMYVNMSTQFQARSLIHRLLQK